MKEMGVLDLNNLNLSVSQELDRIAEELRKPFTDYISCLANGREGDVDWWVSPTSSRNIFASNLYLHICHLVLIDRLLEKEGGYREVIIHEEALASTVKNLVRRKGYKTKVTCSISGKERIIRVLNPLYEGVYSIVHITRMAYWACRTRKLGKKTGTCSTLIETFVYENSFVNGCYQDRYYPGLEENLTDEMTDTCYLAHPYGVNNYRKLFSQLRSSEKRFLIKQDYLSARDYIYAFLHPFRLNSKVFRNNCFAGYDVTPLLKKDIALGRFQISSIDALLNYRFSKGMKEKQIPINTVVDWYENQTIDKGFVLGIKKYFPEARIVGYQGYVGPHDYLCTFPTTKEYQSGVIPHKIAVTGQALKSRVKEFCPELDVIVAPAFRFQGLWEKAIHNPASEVTTLLIALPIGFDESSYILDMMKAVYNRNVSSQCRYWVKPHPANSSDQMQQKAHISSLDEPFKIVLGDFNEWLEQANILISTTSSACVESIAKGVPVVLVGNRNGLTHNPIPPEIDHRMWKICYSVDDIVEAIDYFKSLSWETILEISQTVRDTYFTAVNRQTVKSFWNESHPMINVNATI